MNTFADERDQRISVLCGRVEVLARNGLWELIPSAAADARADIEGLRQNRGTDRTLAERLNPQVASSLQRLLGVVYESDLEMCQTRMFRMLRGFQFFKNPRVFTERLRKLGIKLRQGGGDELPKLRGREPPRLKLFPELADNLPVVAASILADSCKAPAGKVSRWLRGESPPTRFSDALAVVEFAIPQSLPKKQKDRLWKRLMNEFGWVF